MSKVLTSMLYIHPLGCDVYRLAWAIVCYKWVGSPEPQRGNYNSSHATFFVYILALGTGRGANIIHITEPSKDYVFAAYTIYGDSEYINKNFRYEKFPFRIAANPKIPIMDEYYKEVIAAINEKIEQYEV